uniref:Granulin a n=1 Tax=Cyprinus carpio TaxID=7962 RepID=A0A8C1R157_CYPCA
MCTLIVTLLKRFLSLPSLNSASDVPCNDTAACPDGSTCCKTKEGEWACCPLPEAVCCEDFIHCCPHGQKCNVALGTCEDSSGSQHWFEKLPVKLISSQNVHTQTQYKTTILFVLKPFIKFLVSSVHSDVPCNDTAACPDGSTCCKTKEGEWACCPLPQAVCCEDFIHCCPHGKKCNVALGTCEDPSCSGVPWVEQVPVKPIICQDKQTSDVPCNDTAACPDGSTCCKTKEGGWSCCPLPEAVCCEDFIHCCPHGKKCNVALGKCEDSSGSQPWFEKLPVKLISSHNVAVTQDVSCDGTTSCPDGSTCCKTQEGGWACCPLPQAVCCEDFIHCCPHGKKCNVALGTCEDSSESQPWFEKLPVKLISSQNVAVTQVHSDVPCNDTAACPDGSTCCKTKEGGWSCCPLPQAVCCDDFIHCCPHGTTCNVAAGSCDETSGSQPWFEKLSVKLISNVPCDDTVACADGTTCCKTQEGGWACCPLPQAVCCDDFIHCCPHGTTCNVAAGSCDETSGSQPWFEKLSVKLISSQNVAVTQGRSKGNHHQEECNGLCPRPAPAKNKRPGTSRDNSPDLRARGHSLHIVPTSDLSSVHSDVPCDDTVACADGTTCCKTQEGGWACCPLPQAVCCDDFIHCCPHGTTCNVAAESCDETSGSQPWSEKLPVKLISGQNVAVTQGRSKH